VDLPVRLCGHWHSPSLAQVPEIGFADITPEIGPSAAGSSRSLAHVPCPDLWHAWSLALAPFPFDASAGHQIHREGPARQAWACPAQTVDLTEGGQWAPSEVVAVAAVAAVAVVVAVAVAVVGTAIVGAGAAAVAVVIAAVAVAVVVRQDLEWSCVGAYDPAGTGHFWVMFDADKPVSDKLTNVEIMTRGIATYLFTGGRATPLSDTLWLHG
jgi:hypothetical protein